MSAEIQCKKIFLLRCLYAVFLSAGMQFLLLAIFLLFVNVNLLHPVSWISQTMGLVFSLYTWLCLIPLISSVTVYGFVLGNSYLTVKKYYSTRCSWLCGTGFRKLIFFGMCTTIGFLTAWLYSRFLHQDYNLMFTECSENYCLNLRFMFLAYVGIYTGAYFFVKEKLFLEPEVKFPIINERKYVKIRSNFYATLYTCLLKSFVPTICFVIIFWLFGITLSEIVAQTLNLEVNGNLDSLYSLIRNIRLILYSWILSSQILCNMYLTDIFFNILITEPIEFEIERNKMIPDCSGVTLVEALSLYKLPVAQYLATLDLYNISISNSTIRREKLFSLSIPGGHPYNWNHLCSQCLVLINAFCEEVSETVKKLSPTQNVIFAKRINQRQTATDDAQRILLRQYNESLSIRNMMINSQCKQNVDRPRSPKIVVATSNFIKKVHDTTDEMTRKLSDACWTVFRTIPGINYIFGEQENSKLSHIFAQSQYIIFITQALAGLCEKSFTEDKYGVIQTDLPNIVKSLLRLKIILDNLSTVNFSVKKVDRNLIALRTAVKRSLHRISTVFADYMQDFIDNPEELRLIMCFVNYQET